MGCKLCCNNEFRKNQDTQLNKLNNNDIYIKSLEEILDEKYSIPKKIKIDLNEKNNINKNNNEKQNIFNYTQNIVNNNIIQYNSRNNPTHEVDGKIINSIVKEKEDIASMEFDSILNKRETNTVNSLKSKLTENSNINNTNDKEIKNKHKNHKHKHSNKNTFSSEKEEKKSKKKKKSKKEEDKKINDEDNEEKDSNEINCVEPNKMYVIIKNLLKQINYSEVDKILGEAPLRTKTTLDKLIKYFKKNSKNLSELEKAWLIYKWITLNIDYDFAGVKDKNYDISEEATFSRGKTICSGYSKLYKTFGDNLNLIVEFISGYSKGFNYEISDKFEESESHAWNAVKINGNWFLIETTWGAGYSKDHKNFIKKFTSYYFFTPPIQFVRGHFPNDSKWQLLPKDEIIDQKKFMEFINLKSNFYDLGFKSIEPDYTFNYVDNNGNFKLFFDEYEIDGNQLKVTANLYLKDNNILYETENTTLVIRNKNYFEVNYLLNKKAKYKLEIYGAKNDSELSDELCSVILISNKDSSSILSYPKSYGLYSKSDLQIINPMLGTLFNGDKINFEFKTNTFNNLYIGIKNNGNNNFIEMEKQGNTFKEEDILIYGQKVSISTKKEGSNIYDNILEYIVEINPKNKKSAVTFPVTFEGPKNKLIEPICEKLKRGKTVSFKIKSDMLDETAIFIGNTFHKLNKIKNIFNGDIKIEGNGNIVQIGYLKVDNSYGILYQYDIF